MRNAIIQAVKNQLAAQNFDHPAEFKDRMNLVLRLGKKLNLSAKKMEELQLLQETHDMGELSLDEKLLSRDLGTFTPEELEEYQKHTETGYRVALAVPEMNDIALEILDHHEHWDGSGYPKGLREEEIPLLSRVISVVDAYDQLMKTSSVDVDSNLKNLKAYFITNSGKLFDPNVVEAFITLL